MLIENPEFRLLQTRENETEDIRAAENIRKTTLELEEEREETRRLREETIQARFSRRRRTLDWCWQRSDDRVRRATGP